MTTNRELAGALRALADLVDNLRPSVTWLDVDLLGVMREDRTAYHALSVEGTGRDVAAHMADVAAHRYHSIEEITAVALSGDRLSLGVTGTDEAGYGLRLIGTIDPPTALAVMATLGVGDGSTDRGTANTRHDLTLAQLEAIGQAPELEGENPTPPAIDVPPHPETGEGGATTEEAPSLPTTPDGSSPSSAPVSTPDTPPSSSPSAPDSTTSSPTSEQPPAGQPPVEPVEAPVDPTVPVTDPTSSGSVGAPDTGASEPTSSSPTEGPAQPPVEPATPADPTQPTTSVEADPATPASPQNPGPTPTGEGSGAPVFTDPTGQTPVATDATPAPAEETEVQRLERQLAEARAAQTSGQAPSPVTQDETPSSVPQTQPAVEPATPAPGPESGGGITVVSHVDAPGGSTNLTTGQGGGTTDAAPDGGDGSADAVAGSPTTAAAQGDAAPATNAETSSSSSADTSSSSSSSSDTSTRDTSIDAADPFAGGPA